MVRIETPAQAVELLEKAVEQRGADFKYHAPGGIISPTCLYVHVDAESGERTCGCIVGCALAIHGWSMEELTECDEIGNIVTVQDEFPEMFGEGVGLTLQAAQDIQDGVAGRIRGTWGEALAAAREEAAGLGYNDC